MKERAWGEPVPCGEQLPARGLPAATAWGLWGPAPAQQCWQHWSCCSHSVPVSPRLWHAAAAAPSVRAVFLSLACPRQWFCPKSSADPLLPTWSSWQLPACAGVLQVSLGCSAGSSVGWLQALEDSSVLFIWKTLSVTTKNGDGA